MSKILSGGKAKVTIGGKIMELDINDIKITPKSDFPEAIEHDYKPYPYHECMECGDNWMFSTNDTKCMECGSTNIKHENL